MLNWMEAPKWRTRDFGDCGVIQAKNLRICGDIATKDQPFETRFSGLVAQSFTSGLEIAENCPKLISCRARPF
jgi:hypothetical protein